MYFIIHLEKSKTTTPLAARRSVPGTHSAPIHIYVYTYISPMCLRPHMRTPWPNVNFAIFQLGRLLTENSRKYTSLSGSLS